MGGGRVWEERDRGKREGGREEEGGKTFSLSPPPPPRGEISGGPNRLQVEEKVASWANSKYIVKSANVLSLYEGPW